MKSLIFAFLTLFLFSCGSKVKMEDTILLNGYWEIEKVELSDGSEKEYKINETIDYFYLKNNYGFRKKVMPQIDGTYKTNDFQEKFIITKKESGIFIDYSSDFGKRTEEITFISPDKLKLKNKENIEYQYKRPIKFSVK